MIQFLFYIKKHLKNAEKIQELIKLHAQEYYLENLNYV